MSDPSDTDALAKRYLDLWQKQLSGMAADEQVTDLMARTVELMNSGAATLLTLAQAGNPDGVQQEPPSPAGSQAAAPPSGDAEPRVDELLERIAALEERVAELESRAAPKRRSPRSRSSRSRS